MRNIKISIEYDGTHYSGWQIQKNQNTIQATMEKALAKILQRKVQLIGSGRTDTGVHALGQIANFKTSSQLKSEKIQRALNSTLPEDIRIKDIREAADSFHARFSAKNKLYRYTIVNRSFHPPHLRYFSHLVRYPLNVSKIKQAARYLLGRHNLCSFQAADKRVRPSVRTIKRLSVHKKGNFIYLDIEADGFLYRMVRNIVGTLIEVGRGKLNPQDIKTILKARNRVYAGPCAPAKGLCLVKVTYKN